MYCGIAFVTEIIGQYIVYLYDIQQQQKNYSQYYLIVYIEKLVMT